jgi:hypothetical protein
MGVVGGHDEKASTTSLVRNEKNFFAYARVTMSLFPLWRARTREIFFHTLIPPLIASASVHGR